MNSTLLAKVRSDDVNLFNLIQQLVAEFEDLKRQFQSSAWISDKRIGIYRESSVGIGVSPTHKLHVDGKIRIGDDSNDAIPGVIRWTGTNFEGYNGVAWVPLDVPAPSVGGGWSDDGVNVRLITGSDNVGIGLLDPAGYKLNVAGTLYISGAATFASTIGSGAIISTGNIQSASLTPTGLTTGYIPYKSASVLAISPIYTNGTNVGIGLTSPSCKFDVTDGVASLFDTTYFGVLDKQVHISRSMTTVGSATPGSANQFAMQISFAVPAPTGAAATYEKTGIIIAGVTSETNIYSPPSLRDLMGIDLRLVIAADTSTARALGLYADVTILGDGNAIAAEIGINNSGTNQTDVYSNVAKIGQHLLIGDFNPGTVALWIRSLGAGYWHKGIYSEAGDLGTSGSDAFIELLNTFIVKPDGKVGLNQPTPIAPLHAMYAAANSSVSVPALVVDNPSGGTNTSIDLMINGSVIARLRAATTGNLNLFSTGTGAVVLGQEGTNRFRVESTGSVRLAVAGALATDATDGFTYIPSCAGTPTGTPTAYTGGIPLVYDSTNNILYAYSNGHWWNPFGGLIKWNNNFK